MKMQKNKLKRFNIYKKIANVLFVLTIIFGGLGIIISTGGTTYMISKGINIITAIISILPSDIPAVQIIGGADINIPNGIFIMLIIYGIVSLAFIAYIFKSVANIFGNIVKNKTPFNNGIVKALKAMGIAFFVYTFILFVLSIVIDYTFMRNGHIGLNNLDYKNILFGILLLSLGEIFEFGLSLQQDNESIV